MVKRLVSEYLYGHHPEAYSHLGHDASAVEPCLSPLLMGWSDNADGDLTMVNDVQRNAAQQNVG